MILPEYVVVSWIFRSREKFRRWGPLYNIRDNIVKLFFYVETGVNLLCFIQVNILFNTFIYNTICALLEQLLIYIFNIITNFYEFNTFISTFTGFSSTRTWIQSTVDTKWNNWKIIQMNATPFTCSIMR